MQTSAQQGNESKGLVWTGRVLSGLAVLFLLFDSVAKILRARQVIDATIRIGFPLSTIVPIGIVLLVCTALYVIPRTSVLGAILLAAYLGGAVAANVRAGSPAFNSGFAIVFGVLVWLGLYLREPRLRVLLPVRRS
jgi:DoxX-like family